MAPFPHGFVDAENTEQHQEFVTITENDPCSSSTEHAEFPHAQHTQLRCVVCRCTHIRQLTVDLQPHGRT
jgi:hypothetical protein